MNKKKNTPLFLVRIRHKSHIEEVVFSALNTKNAIEKAEKKFPAHTVIAASFIRVYS